MYQKISGFLLKIWNNNFITLLIILLIAINFSWLTFPFYWDEAWSYAMAIFGMAESGPTLIPGHANEWFTRGHPLFFYFIASSWLVIFGKTLLSAHVFALVVSCCSLYIIHFFCKQLFSIKVANFAALSMMVQVIFIAQSSLLLPEIFLMGLSVWVVYLYIKKKWYSFIAVSFCLILSKETALVLFAVLFFDTVFLQKIIYRKEHKFDMTYIREIFFVIIPFLLFGIFLIVQKMNLGYFFYPEHTNLMSFSLKECMEKLSSISNSLFISNLRYIWLCIAVPALLVGIIKKRFLKNDIHIFALSGIFIFAYLLFSSINFFTLRYLLTPLPFIIILYIVIISKSFSGKSGYFLIVVAILVNLYYGLVVSNGEGDCSRNFRQSVMAHKEAVNFCESQQWHDRSIKTNFLMNFNLVYPQLGYLYNVEKPFTNCGNHEFPDIYIFYSSEYESKIDEIRSDINYELVKKIEKPNGCFVEIYEKREVINK